MSNDAVMTVTVKGIGDFSDVVSNVGSVQKALTKLKLPDKLGDNLSKNITNFYKEYEKYQKKISEGVKTQGDYNQVEKSLNNMRNLYQAIGKDAQKLTQLDMKDMLNLDTDEFKKISNEITNIVKQIGSVKIDTSAFTKAFADIRNVTKNSKISGENGLLSQIIGHINTGQIAAAKKELQELQNYANKVAPRETASGKHAPGTLSPEKYQQLTTAINSMNGAVAQAEAAMNPLIEKENQLQKELEETKQKAAQGIAKEFKGYNQASGEVEKLTDSLKRMHQEEFSFNREAQNIDRQIQSYFGLSQMIRKVGDIARDAFATVKELDKAMTETAVVTNFSVGDMWDMLPTYTQQANQLGSTIRDVYEAATLYYQQGLNTNQAMSLANETLKMARIAGLDAADATNMMTAALRGFNMEINQQSAQKINDIYSELAAITASDTKEIGSAMERTASIANSANMEFATTSAFLAQMIETTREAPENLGTAMKTIVARFQEMKQDPTKLVDSEGVAMDANKVDKALKTIGVQLMNTKGEFRDLDDVFLDISAKWDSLTQGQQRYIATIAAGSRQQSRFIAMMSNYERTMELVDAANNSAGASQRQFEKTLDSMEAKLNKLKNAWDQFTMGLMNNQILKFGVDALTEGFTIVNKFIDILGKIPPKPFEGVTKSILTLITTLGMLNLGKKASRGLVMGGAAWWKGEEGGFGKNFMSGFSGRAAKAGTIDGQTYVQNFNNAIKKGQLKEAFNLTNNRAAQIYASNNKTGEYASSFGAAFSQLPAKELSAKWTPQIEAEIRSAFQRATANVDLTKYGIADAQEYEDGLIAGLRSGESSAEIESKILSEMTDGEVDLDATGVNELSQSMENLDNRLMKAGASLQSFGMALQDTPLAPFGAILSKVGMLVSGFGSAISVAVTAGTAAVGYFVSAWAAGVPLVTAGLKAIGVGFKTLFVEMGPVGWAILAIMGMVAAIKGIDLLWESAAEKTEKAADAAAAASDAYDSAKQETSELADSIERIKETDSAFDGLVAGTAEFNEQLVTANEQILALIDKYPMLNDSRYLSTDKNGLMHINEEGFKAVKEYQKQIQARASAMNLIQTADLNALENQQKADKLRKVRGAMTQEEHEKNLRDADLIEQRIEAETKLAHLNAIRTNLVNKEIADQEKIASIYADQYEAKRKVAETEVEAMSKQDRRQAYADYHGYTYNASTKKMKDAEGNEIDYDDKVVKDEVIEQTVMLDFEANASSLEGVLHSLDRAFSKTLGDNFKNSSTFISDVLSNNAETNEDLLQEILDNPKQLDEFTEKLSVKEIAAVLGVSEAAVEKNTNKYKQELENKLLTNARNIIDTNAQANGELAVMLAQAQGKSTNEILIDKNIQNGLIQQVKNFTSEQRNTLLNIGKTLRDSVGSEAMSTFINGLSSIYKSNDEQLITVTQGWVDSVNWESATSRLKGYNEAINMTTENTEHLGEDGVKQINNLGKSLLESTDEANLLGQAFEEFYNSTDFQEMAENMDKFVDSSGQLNAASIMDMAEECHSLNNLLDTGAISAGGVAAALNALGSNGDLVLSDLNSRVLELLSNFGQLDNIIASSHRNIENFDWGIDTGEAEDFVKESAEKWNELYKNGEYGNPQLEAYAKWIMGEDRYIALLASKHGDLKETMAEVSKSVNLYSDGFTDAWDKLAEGSWKNVQFSDDLKDLGISVSFDENGDWEFDPGKATTEQLQKWLEQALKIGPEMAQAMVEDWSNYSPNFRAERQKNDFQAGLDSYIEQRRGVNGGVAITASELETIVGATGQKEDEIIAAIAERAGVDEDQIKILENIDKNTGEYITDGAILNQQLTDAVGAKGQNGWLAAYQAKDSAGNIMKNTIDIEKAMAGAIEKGYTEAQAKSMAYESYTNAEQQGKDYYYKGELIEAGQYKTLDQFAARLEEIDQNEQWVTVGQAMADGFLNRMNELERPEEPSTGNESEGISSNNIPKGTTIPGVGYVLTDGSVASRELTWEDRVPGWVSNLIHSLENYKPEPTEDPKGSQEGAAETNQKIWDWFIGKDTETSEASASLKETATVLTETGTNLTKASSDLSSSAKELSTAASNLSQPSKNNNLNSSNSTIPKGTTIPGPGFVPSNTQSVNGSVTIETAEADAKITVLQTKLKNLNDLINEGGTYNLTVTGVKDIKAAASAAKSLTKNSGTKTIGVKTGKADTSSVDKAKVAIGNTQAKIQVGANVDSAIAAARRAQRTINGMSAKIDVEAHVRKTGINSITIDGKTVNIRTNASGQHNHGYAATPIFGSAAKGYGKVGPKGKGGLTLTGELGYEIAWLPSENRSMILGANGPQMVDLPGDAVVWTHEQSKKILKQKAIPAGSHSNRERNKGGSDGDGGGGDKKKKKKKDGKKTTGQTDSKTIIINTPGFISVWWENMAHRVDATQKKIDKKLNDIEKYFKTFGTTAEDMKKTVSDYKKNLKTTIKLNNQEVTRAQQELSILSGGKSSSGYKKLGISYHKQKISYEEKYKKGKNGKVKTRTQNKTISLAPYIKYNKKYGTYELDADAIKKVSRKNKSKAQAIKDAAEKEINDRNSKLKSAEDAIKKAEEALAKLNDDMYKTFYQWEKSINKIYLLSQKLEILNKQLDISESKTELEFAKIEAGLTDSSAGFSKVMEALQNQEAQLLEKADASRDNFEAARDDFYKSLNITTYAERFKTSTQSAEAKNDFLAARKALKFLDELDFGADNFNYDEALAYINNQDITNTEYEAIKKIIDEIYEKQSKVFEAEIDSRKSITEIVNKIEEYQSFVAEFETDLLSGLEEQTEKEISRLDKLNSSLTDAYKDLLDQVKKELDARRKAEDNKKTESDITKKQQRLAALRADTSGGHQVEIAQLEKEIAEAQQNYQRSLEDQLLEKLQNQGDEAAKQRQQQIELLQAQKDIAEQTGTNLLQVREWLQDPKANKETIKAAWLANHNYDELTPDAQKQLEEQFEVEFTKYLAYSALLPKYMEDATTTLNTIEASVDTIASNIDSDVVRTIRSMREAGISASVLRAAGKYSAENLFKGGYSLEELREAGYSLSTLQDIVNKDPNDAAKQKGLGGMKAGKVDINGSKKGGEINNSHLSAGGTRIGANSGSTLYHADWNETESKAGDKWTKVTIDKLTPDLVTTYPIDAVQAIEYAIKHREPGSKINSKMKELLQAAKKAGHSIIGNPYKLSNGYNAHLGGDGTIHYNGTKDKKDGVYVWNPSTGKLSFRKYDKDKFKDWAKSPNVGAEYKSVLKKKGVKFATGGLADFTGPAWLDGTPSKPELVLNAKDTQNFIALKDILANAMSGMGDTSNTYGDILYEININVDKIEKDYDVDRVVKKVKEEITKGAGYRNVTQVRNFR